MKRRLWLLKGALKRRQWKAALWIVKNVFGAILWPFCKRCGKIGWFGGSPCCWPCQYENLFRALREEAEAEILKRYRVEAEVYVYAETPQEAMDVAASALQCYDMAASQTALSGAHAHVQVEETKRTGGWFRT